MKVLIVYLSKHHTTEQYAKWIHQEVESDLISLDQISKVSLDNYSVIVFGSWVYLDRIEIRHYITDNWSRLKYKRIVLFSSSITSPEDPKIKEIYTKSFPKHIRDSIHYFPLSGKLNIDSLSFIEKLTLRWRRKYRELNELDQARIRPVIVKIYDLKVLG